MFEMTDRLLLDLELATRKRNLIDMAEDQPLEETTQSDAPKAKKLKSKAPSGPLFTLKKWNAVAMWSWDVECDTCAICRVQVMGEPFYRKTIL